MERAQEQELPRHADLVDERLVLWYFVAALTFMFASMLGGVLMGTQLSRMNPLRGIEFFSPGRWRMIHTNAIAYGFLANAFLGMLEWVVPRLTLKPVFDRRLSYAIFFAWQGVVIATAVGILFGEAQGLEWGETPVWIDPIALAGIAPGRNQFRGADRQDQGAHVCHPLVLPGRIRLDVSDLRDG